MFMGFESDLFIIAVIYVINSGLHFYFGWKVCFYSICSIFTKYGKDEYEATVVNVAHAIELSYTTVIFPLRFGSEGGHTTPASDLIISF